MDERSFIAVLRDEYHRGLLDSVWGFKETARRGVVPSNADVGSEPSIQVARAMLSEQRDPTPIPAQNQSAGKIFTAISAKFVQNAFLALQHLRPGRWEFRVDQNTDIARFVQYRHLAALDRFLAIHRDDKDLQAAFRNDYRVKPDIAIGRIPVADAEINQTRRLIAPESQLAGQTPLRASNDSALILHGSVSCKWTLRSDRAQNIRTEALALIRTRKGSCPHIVAVTAEPMPSRLASIAQGTGDVDCMYHMGLFELIKAVNEVMPNSSQSDVLETLVAGDRLRDISDLPFDLAV